MNIKDAKEQIKNAMVAYFSKDKYGNYEIPLQRQRPIFVMGPPGIGKTAIMEQIAQELGVSLVSYSMTHHTRQSAIGLPFIEKKVYGGTEYSVSEYTMSEIIASVYEMTEDSGNKEGILFLDEINCVSETLNPAMLQFLQYKIFGKHQVPEGWIVVTAGNPPEYNDSVHEFDIATWDRLKRIDVEADYYVWKEYAYTKNIHPSILTYLDIKKSNFYIVETTVDGKSFVTARGWSDLSDMISLYEKNNIKVDEKLISQYLQNKAVAKSFAVYYDLFNKYKSDYQIIDILNGNATNEIKKRAQNGKFDERLALLGMMIDAISEPSQEVYHKELTAAELLKFLKPVKSKLSDLNVDVLLSEQIKRIEDEIQKRKKASSLSKDMNIAYMGAIASLEEMLSKIKTENPANATDAFSILKTVFDMYTAELKKVADSVGKCLSNVFNFCEEIFSDGDELLILVTELTLNYYTARFISRYGCTEYFNHNKELLFYERQKELIEEIEELDLEDEQEDNNE